MRRILCCTRFHQIYMIIGCNRYSSRLEPGKTTRSAWSESRLSFLHATYLLNMRCSNFIVPHADLNQCTVCDSVWPVPIQYQTGKRDTQAKQPCLSSIEFEIKIFCIALQS